MYDGVVLLHCLIMLDYCGPSQLINYVFYIYITQVHCECKKIRIIPNNFDSPNPSIPRFVQLVSEFLFKSIFASDVHLFRDNSLDLRCQERTRVTNFSSSPSTMPRLPFISVTCWTHGHDMTTHMLWAWTPRRWSHAHHMIMTCQSQACAPTFKLKNLSLGQRPHHSFGN